MVRAMCGKKLLGKRNTMELMDMLGLKEAADKLARANGVSWYVYILRQPEKDVLMKAVVHEVDGKRKQGQQRMKWREQVEKNIRRIGLRKDDAADWCRKNCRSSGMHLATSSYWRYLNQIKNWVLELMMGLFV